MVAGLAVAKSPFAWGRTTVVGCRDLPDGVERSAVLAGVRHDVDDGTRLTVAGRLPVIDHPADTVGGVRVPV